MRTVFTLVLLIAAVAAATGHALAGAVTVNNYYQHFQRVICPNSEMTCTLTFSALPTNKDLIVRQASCFLAMISGGPRYLALESYKAINPTPVLRTFVTPITGTGVGFHTATVELAHLVSAGQVLKVHADATSGQIFSLECSVLGTLVPD